MGQRPGNGHPTYLPSPEGAKPNNRRIGRVTPRWGLEFVRVPGTRGDAPGKIAPHNIQSPERAQPNPEAREIKSRIAGNTVEILEV